MVNGILTNAEIWHPIKDDQMDVLENVDLMYIRKILKGHSKAPKETFFMETGLLPFKFITMKRRLMYLHTILHKPKSELIRKVYDVQKVLVTKNDWCQLVEQNRKELSISYSDEEIEKMSAEKFKSIVTKSVQKMAMGYLNNMASTHEKSKPLMKPKLIVEDYFLDTRFSKSEIELLFAFRTRMVRDIKNNFPKMHNTSIACDLCHVQICSQQHLLQCSELRKHVIVPKDVEYSHLYKDTEKQLKFIKTMKKLLRTREILKCK